MKNSPAMLAVAIAAACFSSGNVFAQASETVGAPVASIQGGPASPYAASQPVPRGTVLVDEYTGRFITHPTGGVGGAPASAIQSSLSMTLFGAGSQIASNNWVAEDFTVPAAGWSISTARFYTYQSFSTTTPTINDLRIQIFTGTPGGTLAWGDTTTNRLTSTTFSGVYRVTETTLTNVDRPVMEVVAQFSPPIQLPAGTHWIAWQLGGTLASGPWTPPQVVIGSATSGNCQQSLAGAAYAQLLDAGSATAQGCPFVLEGGTLPVSLQSYSVD